MESWPEPYLPRRGFLLSTVAYGLALSGCAGRVGPAASTAMADSPAVKRVRLDTGWKFRLADDGPEAAHLDFDDNGWRMLEVPHDFSIEGTISQDNPGGVSNGFYPGGVGWYRLALAGNPDWANKRIILTFDGIMMRSTIFVNGAEVASNPYGYLGTTIDVTDQIRLDGDNVIAVRSDNSAQPSSRWYTGSGIYRNVWLDVRDPVHLVQDGGWVRTVAASQAVASLLAAHEVRNDGPNSLAVALQSHLLDPTGHVVWQADYSSVVPAGSTVELEYPLSLVQPLLWSPSNPALYTLRTRVSEAGRVCDERELTVGIRTIEATLDRGFLLNGSPIELQGVCLHHDGGPVGAAVPKDVWRQRLELLKQMGVNAIRVGHSPFAPEFYDLTDRLGLMVMDEAFDGWGKEKAPYDYGLYFEDRWEEDLTKFVRRSRPHPSVVLYSVGNEVAGATAEMQGKLVRHLKSLDATRPVTQGEGYGYGQDDIAGFNGHGEFKGAIEAYHSEHPTRPIIGTEITHSLHTRGVYRSKTEYRTRDNPAPWEIAREDGKTPMQLWNGFKARVWSVPDLTSKEAWPGEPLFYASSFDNNLVRMPIRDQIGLAKKLPYLLGTFRWTGIDYLGEAYAWPARTANFGVIDLAGFPKDVYHLYRSRWSDEPMVFVSPHWTHRGKAGVPLPVVVYTNLDEAELFLNDKSLGRKSMGDGAQIEWIVPYAPGSLRAVAYGANGVSRTFEVKTAGTPTQVQVTSDAARLAADGHATARIAISIADADGTVDPHASNRVTVGIRGPGRLIGIENGDILEHQSVKDDNRKAFKGQLAIFVQALREAGAITVTATSPGLAPGIISLSAGPPSARREGGAA